MNSLFSVEHLRLLACLAASHIHIELGVRLVDLVPCGFHYFLDESNLLFTVFHANLCAKRHRLGSRHLARGHLGNVFQMVVGLLLRPKHAAYAKRVSFASSQLRRPGKLHKRHLLPRRRHIMDDAADRFCSRQVRSSKRRGPHRTRVRVGVVVVVVVLVVLLCLFAFLVSPFLVSPFLVPPFLVFIASHPRCIASLLLVAFHLDVCFRYRVATDVAGEAAADHWDCRHRAVLFVWASAAR